MIGGYLAFARGEGTEQAEPVDLAAVLEDVAAGARRAGARGGAGRAARADAAAARRCGAPRHHQPGRQCPPPRPPRRAGGRCRWARARAGDGGRRRPRHPARPARERVPPVRERAPAAAPASGSPSRATSCARMAARSCWRTARWAACAPGSGCPFERQLDDFSAIRLTSSIASMKRLCSSPTASALACWIRSPSSFMLATACS